MAIINELKRYERFFGLFVALLAFSAYGDSLWNGFIGDDHSVILNNPVLKGDPLAVFKTIDTLSDTLLLPYYRPLTYLSFLIEGRIHGFNPFLMHLLNVLLHSLNTFLVYRLGLRLTGSPLSALLGGLLFGLHPVNTEAVNFLSGGRNTLLATTFSMAAVILYMKGSEKGGFVLYILSGAAFVCGAFSKEFSLMISPVVFGLELLKFRAERDVRASVTRLLPFVIGGMLYLYLRWETLSALGIQKGIIPGAGMEGLEGMFVIPSFWDRMRDNLYAIPKYLMNILWPFRLSPNYRVPEDLNLFALPLALGWLAIAGISVSLLVKRRDRVALFCLAWAFLLWLPVSGVFYFSSVNVADRFLYGPAIGLWILAGDMFNRSFIDRDRRQGYAFMIILLFIFIAGAGTALRNLDWKDDLTLFRKLVRQYPDNPVGHFNLGSYYVDRYKQKGERDALDIADEELSKALSLDPNYQDAYTALGLVRLEKGMFADAVKLYTRALEFFPLNRDARINRAIAYERLGMYREALKDYRFYLTITTRNNIPGSNEYALRRIEELKSYEE